MLYALLFEPIGTLEFHIVREYVDRDGGDNLIVSVEKKENRQVCCEWILPDIFCRKAYGFTDDELFDIEEYLRDNESIMWDDWRDYQRELKQGA